MRSLSDASEARILIVDDQLSNIRLIEFTLRRAGFTGVTSTVKASEVSAMHVEHHYDLIVLDLQMPGTDGFDVMDQLSDVREAIPVEILVMSAGGENEEAALASGATRFLGKPYKLPDVVKAIQTMLGLEASTSIEAESSSSALGMAGWKPA
jgi:CheY-like chemotaxis protein